MHLLRRSLKLSPSESHIFKIVSQEVGQSNGFGRHVVADGRRPCEGARRCQASTFFHTSGGDHSPVVATQQAARKRLGPSKPAHGSEGATGWILCYTDPPQRAHL